MQITHSFFCLGLEGHNNAGLKTRACQSSYGRVLSLNRQADIGPHPAPQVHPKFSVPIKNEFSFPAIGSMKKELTSASLPCVIRINQGLSAINFVQKNLFVTFCAPLSNRRSFHYIYRYFSRGTKRSMLFAELNLP